MVLLNGDRVGVFFALISRCAISGYDCNRFIAAAQSMEDFLCSLIQVICESGESNFEVGFALAIML